MGLEFPIAGKLYLMRKGELGTTAGTIDSADHAGAFIGALLTGVLFVPLFGISGSCIIIAVSEPDESVVFYTPVLSEESALRLFSQRL